MQLDRDLRNGFKKPVAVTAFLEMTGEIAIERLPKSLRGDPADRFASDDGEPPGRPAGIHQNRCRPLRLRKIPFAKELFRADGGIRHRLVVDHQTERSTGVPPRRSEPGLDLLALGRGQEGGSAESGQ